MPSFFRRAAYHLLPLCLLTVFLGGSAGQAVLPSGSTFRSNVNEVRLTFLATDRNDHVLANIQSSDFAIVDQSYVVRSFRSFRPVIYSGLNLAILVDTSGSIGSRFARETASLLKLTTAMAGLPNQSVVVLTFRGTRPEVLCETDCSRLNLTLQPQQIAIGGPTPLFDSLVLASRSLSGKNGNNSRRALVVFSDGEDTISLRSLAEVKDEILAADVTIYAVDESPAPHLHPGTLTLRELAASTGGRYFRGEDDNSDLADILLEDFRSAYSVSYKLPTVANGFHLVRILPTHDRDLQFHCRRGYYYPSPAGD